eukprot:2942032-Prymnesium_polylepis.1
MLETTRAHARTAVRNAPPFCRGSIRQFAAQPASDRDEGDRDDHDGCCRPSDAERAGGRAHRAGSLAGVCRAATGRHPDQLGTADCV